MTFPASKTARVMLCGVAFCAASSLSCARKTVPKAVTPPPHEPPAKLLVVAEERVSVESNAWTELHARLAAAARIIGNGGPDGDDAAAKLPSELRSGVIAYARTLEHDSGDELLGATFRGLAHCTDDACAFGILEPTGFASQFRQTLPWFVAREWDARAKKAWRGVERIHEVVGPRLTAVLDILVQNLSTSLGPVVVVASSPPSGNAALLEPALAADGLCFNAPRVLDSAVQNARLLDCVAVRAVLAGDAPLRATFGERLWTTAVVHEVAMLVTGFEPRHISVDRRGIAIAAPDMLDFVSAELKPRSAADSGQHRPEKVTPELGQRWKDRASAPAGSASH